MTVDNKPTEAEEVAEALARAERQIDHHAAESRNHAAKARDAMERAFVLIRWRDRLEGIPSAT